MSVAGIRSYRSADRDAVYDVCVRTASAGVGVKGLFSSDDILGDVFAGPYLEFEPELAFVVDGDDGVAGYLVGAANTRAFVVRYTADRLPGFAAKHAGFDPTTREGGYIRSGMRPERMLVPEVDEYPPHLHLNLLPELRGRGIGRGLLATFAGALLARGIERFHVTPSSENANAIRFYEAVGFTHLPSSTPKAPILGIECARLAG